MRIADINQITSPFVVFYCWQSHINQKLNRYLIRDALKGAIRDVQRTLEEKNFDIELVFDSDTSGRAGSVAVADEILKKIRNCSMFIADVTPTLASEDGDRAYPNPNVMLELGFAVQAVGWSKISLVLNRAFGTNETLPFDIRHRRIGGYDCEDLEQRTTASGVLRSLFANAITMLLEEISRGEYQKDAGADVPRERDLRLLREVMETIHVPTVHQFIESGLSSSLFYDAVFYWESFNSIVKSAWFRFYDSELKQKVEQFHAHWQNAVYYGSLLFSPGDYPNQYVRTRIYGPSDQQDYDRMNAGYVGMQTSIRELLDWVHQNYLEIDERETSKIAFERMRPYLESIEEEQDA